MSCHVFLELLAREASAVEFDGPVLDARARGDSPDDVESLERAKAMALKVRTLLEQRSRREAELAALFETAGDLAGLRDLDAVLTAITHRVRQLLRTDIAYLSLNDDDRGDTYMRVTDGSISARFQRVRLPMGAGLGGLVAQTATPYATANYFDDGRFHHTQDIDAAVTDEGLVSILGAPLLLGSRVLGVLYAANRSERPFAREEVALLSSLAAHAAVAIDNARLLEETRAAVEELRGATELLRARSASVERAAAAHDRFTDVVLRGGGVEDVAAAVSEVLGATLMVLDEHDRVLVGIGSPDAGEADARKAAAAAQGSPRTMRVGDHWVARVAAGTENLGALVLAGHPGLDEADQRILERAAVVTALLLLFRRTVAEAEGRVRGELLDDLLSHPGRDVDGLRERGRRLGVDLDRPHAVVAATVDGVTRQRLTFAANQIAAARGGIAGEYSGHAVLLLPDAAPGSAAASVAAEMTAALGRPVTAGAAGPAGGPPAMVQAHGEALRCARALRALGREGEGAGIDDLGFVGLVLGEGRDVSRFIQGAIGAVVDYDARRGTGLVLTLETYFAQGGNLARTAEALHVHVNTVGQRLERVSRLIGADWQTPQRSLELQLALRLHRLGPAT